jgi:alpha-1,2-mannosyltransferase
VRRAPQNESRGLDAAMAIGALALFAAGLYCAKWMMRDVEYPHDLADLAVYRAAGRAVLDGHSVYGQYVHDQLRVPLPFIYPPIAAVFAIPFTWLGETPAKLMYTVLCLGLLAGVVRVCFSAMLDRMPHLPVAFALTFGAVLALSPVEDHVRFGQVGIPLLACCVFDCMARTPRWPRGLLVGAATAVKLVPGIFIPYFLLTRRWKAAAVSAVTFAVLTLMGVAVAPSDSWKFFSDKMFEPTSPWFFANQSLQGILERAIGPWRLVWLPLVVGIVVFGLWRASRASLAGDELRGVAITGLISVLVSPISWIHHLVWIIPALAVIIGRGTDRRRVAAAFAIAALFVLRLPYLGAEDLHGTGFVANVLEDAYGLLCLGMFIWLTDAIPLARAALRGRAEARSRATTPAAPR